MKITYWLSVLFLLNVSVLWAQNIEFKASAPAAVTTGERFRLVYSVNVQPDNFTPPDFKGLQASGPSTASSSSMSIINGQVSQSFSYTYTYYVVAPKKGTYALDAATIKVGGKTYKSNNVSIEVVGEAQTGQSNNKDLYVLMTPSKSSVYQGEHLVLTIKLYTRLDVVGFDDSKLPSFDGFWKQEIETPDNIQLERENVGGVAYQTGTLYRYLLFPQNVGQITINPFELEVGLGRRTFFGLQRAGSQRVYSQAVTINVKPLPDGAPAGFGGAVGSFKMTSSLDRKEVKANDAITLKMRIEGTGNIQLVNKPNISFPSDFEVYDPKIDEKQSSTVAGTSGYKTFEYVIIPRNPGDFKLDPVQFSYFDVNQGKYITLTSDAYEIKVTPSDNSTQGGVVSNSVSKQGVQLIGSDIRFIKTESEGFSQRGDVFFGTGFFYTLLVLPLLILLGIFAWRKNKAKQEANVELLKNKRAGKVSKQRLKAASSFLQNDRKQEFYAEVLRAQFGYISDKLGIAASELSRDNISERLQQRGVSSDVTKRLMDVISTCEYARYAPSGVSGEMHSVYDNAASVINDLEQTLR